MRASAEKRAFDWTEASARLERVARRLSGADERSAEETRRILERRARDMARPAAAPPSEDLAAVVVFPIARERYAVDLACVVEVARLCGLTPLPGAPAPVLGIVLHRGRLLPVVDLRRLLGGGEAAVPQAGWLVVVGAGDALVGLLADGAVEVARVPSRGLAPPLVRGGVAEPLLRGLTRDAVAVLDVLALMTDPRLATGKAG
jgi:purine-binding chemotaxis protein CheW